MRAASLRVASDKWARLILHTSVFILLFLVACSSEPSVSTVTDTGLMIAPDFTSFYEEQGGKRIFGDPITLGFAAPDTGRRAQYFQNARLDFDKTTQEITVFPLGEWAFAGLKDPQPAPVPENSAVRAFAETGLTVQDEFLSFYETYNGDLLLGLPISFQLDEGVFRVQYFENGRLEWHPELPIGQRIQLSALGQSHFDAEMSFVYVDLHPKPVPYAGLTQASVHTFAQKAVLYAGAEQTLFVTVFAPNGRPVEDIPVTVTARYGETTQSFDLGRTNVDGRIKTVLPSLDIPPGQRVILETAVYSYSGNVIGTSTVTFKTWW